MKKFVRPTVDAYFLAMAHVVATRATCRRRRVGCVLVDSCDRILSTGYNGNASGLPHCIDKACPGAGLASGTGLDKCEAVHAEINALIFCPNNRSVKTAYLTTTPCVSCVKALLTSSCERIVASSSYPHPEARLLWEGAGRKWEVLTPDQHRDFTEMRKKAGVISAGLAL